MSWVQQVHNAAVVARSLGCLCYSDGVTCRNKYNEASFHVQLECSSNVVGEKDILYKPEKILALKDIDPEERMNMVKAIVTEISNLCKLGVFSLEVMEDSMLHQLGAGT